MTDTIARMSDLTPRDDALGAGGAVLGFILGAPCGFVAATILTYFIGIAGGDRLADSKFAGVIFVVLLLILYAALGFVGFRFSRCRRRFLAGVMFGLACGVLAFALLIMLMATSTGHGVVS